MTDNPRWPHELRRRLRELAPTPRGCCRAAFRNEVPQTLGGYLTYVGHVLKNASNDFSVAEERADQPRRGEADTRGAGRGGDGVDAHE